MDHEAIYSAINLAVMPAWLLLALAPRWVLTRVLVHSGLYPIVYGIIYVGFLVAAFSTNADNGGTMSTLEGVMTLFDNPTGVIGAWSHYLVFDLFVGAWIGRDALRKGVSHWLVVPSLFFTLMAGPLGLLVYLIGAMVTGKRDFSLGEATS